MIYSENFLEGSVSVEGRDKSVLLQGHASLNRAVDGDIVAVELLDESMWTAPSGIVLEDQDDLDPGDEIDKEEALLKSSRKGVDLQPTGRIVGIIRRKWRQYCGILLPSVLKEGTRHLFVPAERKIPKIRIETRQASTLATQKIIVSIDSWPRTSRYPQGHFVRGLGNIGDKETENEVIFLRILTHILSLFIPFFSIRFCYWSMMFHITSSPKQCLLVFLRCLGVSAKKKWTDVPICVIWIFAVSIRRVVPTSTMPYIIANSPVVM